MSLSNESVKPGTYLSPGALIDFYKSDQGRYPVHENWEVCTINDLRGWLTTFLTIAVSIEKKKRPGGYVLFSTIIWEGPNYGPVWDLIGKCDKSLARSNCIMYCPAGN